MSASNEYELGGLFFEKIIFEKIIIVLLSIILRKLILYLSWIFQLPRALVRG